MFKRVQACPAPLTPEDAVAAAVHLAPRRDLLHVCAVVGREVDERVVGQAQAVERVQDLTWGEDTRVSHTYVHTLTHTCVMCALTYV